MNTRKLEFNNLDARPRVSVLFIREEGVADVMRWYGGFFAGDRYSVSVDGVKVQKDMDGNLIGSISSSEGAGVYIASKTKYASEWIAMRDNGYPIISTWIDEAGEGQTGDWPDLWSRCVSEASSAKSLVVISRDGDTLKGAWVEVGAALGAGKTVFAAGCHSFTVRHHPRFVICASEEEAFARAALAQKGR